MWGDVKSPHTFVNYMKRILHSPALTWWFLGIITTGLFIVYLSILPDHLVSMSNAGDGGDFLAAMLTHGIPHPTGYPTYMLLGQVFLLFPWSTPYFKVALLSAIATACAAGLLFLWVSRHLTNDRKSGLWVGIAAALAWGTAPLVFSQAVIVEVYALQSLLILCNIWWVTLLINGVKSHQGLVAVQFVGFHGWSFFRKSYHDRFSDPRLDLCAFLRLSKREFIEVPWFTNCPGVGWMPGIPVLAPQRPQLSAD